MKRPVPFPQAMKLPFPNAFPFTTIWPPETSTASAISGFETEKRSIGLSKVMTLDWPTSTLTGIASLVPVKKEAVVVCSCAKTGKAQSRVVTRTTMKLRMERDCMIIFSLTDWGQRYLRTRHGVRSFLRYFDFAPLISFNELDGVTSNGLRDGCVLLGLRHTYTPEHGSMICAWLR